MAKIEITKAAFDTAAWDTDLEIRDDYSGRGMYGESCWGVVGELDSLRKFEVSLAKGQTAEQYKDAIDGSIDVEAVLDAFEEHLEDIQNRRRTDNMGMSYIWYYPSIELVD